MFVWREGPLGKPPGLCDVLRGSVERTPWRSAWLLVMVLLSAVHAALLWIAGRSSVLVVVALVGAGIFFAAWVRLRRN